MAHHILGFVNLKNRSQRANDLADQARDTLEQGKERVRSGITAIRNVAGQQGGDVGESRTGTEGGGI